MVNTTMERTDRLDAVTRIVRVYVVLVVATLVALALLSALGSDQATQDAWVHAAIVAGFAVLLPLRLRAARRGRDGALRAVGVIASVLLAVNAVEAFLSGLFPLWMRLEMVVVAVLMAGVVALVRRARAEG